jgi:5-methylcytosine-specific restriction endonuclease McrA
MQKKLLKKVGTDAIFRAAALRVRKELASLPLSAPTDPIQFRNEVKKLAVMLGSFRILTREFLRNLTTETAARNRILAYLKMCAGETVEGLELAVVGGIQDYPRRIRELRVQFGYNISTGYSRNDLRPNQYVLETADPDIEAAQKWRVANGIRKQPGAAEGRILALLKAFIGHPVTGEQIAYVAKIREAPRRVRELRTEHGWRIATKNTGRPDLSASVYVLESEQQLPQHDRKIPDAVYEYVLERDMCRCRKCGWHVNDRNPASRRQFLEVHHIIFHHKGGANEAENLMTLCNIHHDEVHRLALESKQFKSWLMTK